MTLWKWRRDRERKCVGGKRRVTQDAVILRNSQIFKSLIQLIYCIASASSGANKKGFACDGKNEKKKMAQVSNHLTRNRIVKLRLLPIYEKWTQAQELFGCLELKPG